MIGTYANKLIVGLNRVLFRYRIWKLRCAGLNMPKDCRLTAVPSCGSEPYLINIGHHVTIAAGVAFITHDGGTHVFREEERYKHVIRFGRINILDNCVIGFRAVIMPGVTIGPNSVVGACSCVTRSVPPNTVVSGNPAKPIMSIHQYAEWSLARTPKYDVEAFRRDKRQVLLTVLPKLERRAAIARNADEVVPARNGEARSLSSSLPRRS